MLVIETTSPVVYPVIMSYLANNTNVPKSAIVVYVRQRKRCVDNRVRRRGQHVITCV